VRLNFLAQRWLHLQQRTMLTCVLHAYFNGFQFRFSTSRYYKTNLAMVANLSLTEDKRSTVVGTDCCVSSCCVVCVWVSTELELGSRKKL
jgi:hypothetical protein